MNGSSIKSSVTQLRHSETERNDVLVSNASGKVALKKENASEEPRRRTAKATDFGAGASPLNVQARAEGPRFGQLTRERRNRFGSPRTAGGRTRRGGGGFGSSPRAAGGNGVVGGVSTADTGHWIRSGTIACQIG